MRDYKRLTHLFVTQARSVQGYFKRHGPALEAPDLSQEVFLRLLRLESLESIRDPQAYLFTVATNLLRERAYVHARDAQPRLPIEGLVDRTELSFDDDTDEQMDRAVLIQRLRSAVRQLPQREREVLSAVYAGELSYREIARQLGISKTAVEKTVARATARCRKLMDVEDGQ